MAEYGFKLTGDQIKYDFHDHHYDKVAVLACQIKVWEAKAPNWFDNSQAKVFTEVESIDIFNSYKKLIGTATIKIPKGSVIYEAQRKNSYDPEISTGNTSKKGDEAKVSTATNSGDLIAPGTTVDIHTNKVLQLIDPIRPDVGLIEVNKETERIIDKNDFAIGNRIEIRMGYLYEPDEDVKNNKHIVNDVEVAWNPDDLSVEEKQKMLQEGKELKEMDLVFTGFITGISPVSPLEIKCENMASILKKKSSPELEAKKNYTVGDFLGEGSKFDLLKGTGLKLAEVTDSKKDSINVGKVNLHSNHTVFDILEEWQKCGLLCMVERNGKALRIGRALWSGVHDNGNPEYLDYRKSKQQNIIQFDWDVAEDKLSIINSDKKFLAVDATGWFKDGKQMKTIAVTVRKDGDGNWDVVNEKDPPKSKKQQKATGGQSNRVRIKSKVDLETYTRVPYVMYGTKCTVEELTKQAKAYYNRFNMCGISGGITLFGDRFFQPSDIVCLLDTRQPEKNGYYLIESVTTTFGVNGYRHEIKTDYKVGDVKTVIQYVEL